MFAATFKVKSDLSPGSTIGVSASATSTDGDKTSPTFSASWSATVAAPLSSNARLSSLSCGNSSLSPAFSADTTSYSVTVPYDVTSLSLSYKTQDGGAKVSVSGNSLSVGSNTVTLTVTAANGNTKKYVIYATRQQDPNYVPSTNALLSSLSLSSGTLSPAFDPEVMDYVVYLPYEAESFELGGVAQDGKARSVTGSSADLEPGDNPMTVVCVAEDGTTRAEYTVHVYRMPAYEGTLPKIIDQDFADYTAVDEALTKVPADLSVYTEESAKTLQEAVNAVVRDLPSEKQAEVDAMAKAIEAAISALEEAPIPEPEPELTPWQKLLAVGGEAVTVPYVSDLTGPLPMWAIGLAALVLLLLLAYLIGTLIGRAVGKRRTLRRLQAASVPGDAEDEGSVVEEPVSEGAEAEPPAEEEPVPEAEENEAPVADEPAPENAEVDAPAADEPAPEVAEAEAPVADEPAPENAEVDAPAADQPAPEVAETEVPAVDEPVPDATEAEAPAADELDETIRHMSLDDLLDDIRNM